MATLSQVRNDLATRMAAIDGLNTYPKIPDLIEEPAAVVGMPDPMEYNLVFGPTGAVWTIPVRLYVCRYDAEDAQEQLDAYIAPTGTTSIKYAIEEGTSTLTSAWHAVTVVNARNFGAYRVGDIDYLGCEFTVEVVAT